MAALELTEAVVVDFPLRGEWTAVNTPARRVPSHGTDFFGQRFAIDFVQLDAKTGHPSASPVWRHLLVGLPVTSFLSWGQPVYAAFSGRVIAAGDRWPDRTRVHGLWELFRASVLSSLLRPTGEDYRPLTGNFLLVEGTPGVALYAHLRRDSLRVAPGDEVITGMPLAAVGNSGNSTMPHLHFHVMDGSDPRTARGRLCAFRSYARYVNGARQAVSVGVPEYLERVRAG